MRFLCNTYDPSLPDAKQKIARQHDETPAAAWRWYLYWLSDKVIGEPQETPSYSVEELKAMGMVGVYKP